VTAYAVKRPDGEWSVLLVNKDASNAHRVKLVLDRGDASVARQFLGTVSLVTFGAAEYVWHPDGANSHADPDGPLRRISITADKNSAFELPKASVAVLRGKMNE
jgi:hypothetical protein